jgi:predicted ATPase/DNA-binding winged helix-turn-helix (wHTH) protein
MMASFSQLSVGARDPWYLREIHFGPFRLIPRERKLERDGVAVPLGGRALDILVALAERPGQVVSKGELCQIVWPDMIVEEGSLRFHIVSLRKALGENAQDSRYLTTVAGRGYCFTGVTFADETASSSISGATAPEMPRLPPHLRRIVGMTQIVADAASELMIHRFLSLVGPAGIGKTTLAIQLGHDLQDVFLDGVAFVDLGGVSAPLLLPNVIASATGRVLSAEHALANLIASFRGRQMLLIFDSCEHLIDSIADLAEKLFRDLPDLSILTTSRESLRVEGEHVYRLFPLGYPPVGMRLSAKTALTFPAVELFVERIQASQVGFQLEDEDAPLVAQICRKLDGIPLALELAAGRVPAYGIKQTSALLDGHLRLLWQGRRTAPPRLQTLRAALDWSHDLLSIPEQAVLRRISGFVGSFTLGAATAVASCDDVNKDMVLQILANLVAKSLLVMEDGVWGARYRLLDTTRIYALTKLLASAEAAAVIRRTAAFCPDPLSQVDLGQESIAPDL